MKERGGIPRFMAKTARNALKALGYQISRVARENEKEPPQDSVNIERFMKRSSIKLHVGCGPRVLKGWINIDIRYEPYDEYLQYYTDTYYPEEIRGGTEDFLGLNVCEVGLPFPDSSVDLIFDEDFIEHLSQKEQILFLAESFRVLKRGAVHRISTPNLLTSMARQSHFEAGKSGVFFEEWDKNEHRNVLTPALLVEVGKMIGFTTVSIESRNKSKAIGLPLEYRPDPRDRGEDGNFFADLVK